MGFGPLRVINEDRVAPGGGFPAHPHRDMEILSYVLEGGLEHKDSLGTGSVIYPGDLQRMSAGTGIRHSELNASNTEPVHFLQIWIEPAQVGIAPGYEQKAFPVSERRGRLRLLASPHGGESSVTLHQDVKLFGALLESGETVSHTLAPRRGAGVQVARGAIEVNGHELSVGDGAAIEGHGTLDLTAREGSEVLLFDLYFD